MATGKITFFDSMWQTGGSFSISLADALASGFKCSFKAGLILVIADPYFANLAFTSTAFGDTYGLTTWMLNPSHKLF